MSTTGVAVGSDAFVGTIVLEVITSVGLSAGSSVAVVVVGVDVLHELIIKMIQRSMEI